jgi:hypothetical protein
MVLAGAPAAITMHGDHRQMPGDVIPSDGAMAAGRRLLWALSRWIVLRSPASHGAIEARRVAAVESKARFGGAFLLPHSIAKSHRILRMRK